MTFTKETPTKPGYYLWRTKLTSGPVTSEIFPLGEGGPLFIDTDDTREELSAFVNEVKVDNLEWCRLVPADEVEKAWRECKESIDPWEYSRAKRVMEGVE